MKFLASLVLALVTAAAKFGTANAAEVTYQIDPTHTYPSFEADHMGLSLWRGKLNKSEGEIVYDKANGTGRVEVRMNLASIDFGLPAMNAWATGEKFFNLAKNSPTAVYTGSFTSLNGVPKMVQGELTLNGLTKPVVLNINQLKCIPHPMLKRDFCGADASGSFNREDFGLGVGKEWGFKMDVMLRIQVEAVAKE